MTDSALPFITADQVRERVSMADAVAGLDAALQDGFDPAGSLARANLPLSRGSLLLMPAEAGDVVGVKIASVAPDNPAVGLPKIQGAYLLMSATTLAPLAVLDGAALTEIRTPALSALGVKYLARSDRPLRVALFGTGPQAYNHIAAIAAVREVGRIDVIGRTLEKAAALAERLVTDGYDAHASLDATEAVPAADLVQCCTSASEPLFDGLLVRDDAVVVAMGSHEPDVRELDAGLVGRSTVYVEDVDTALREAGDVVMAIGEGTMAVSELKTLRSLVVDGPVVSAGPALYKTTGMGWEDLVVAGLAYRD
ncbi:ornithine cyclodeaminase family protein [Corynebacterium nuruki]|uniref:Ornithine cyclodeaminase n=1 Tax=Corynebacterium nuruki TaxID=1032851 RepID=A0A3D4SWL9_9CORY|nr:ornithine cyclodeaminase [Corynebacterium nuruki]HCT13683.1 ornithine cyclodeaminase [Corynebacterium nuruki]